MYGDPDPELVYVTLGNPGSGCGCKVRRCDAVGSSIQGEPPAERGTGAEGAADMER